MRAFSAYRIFALLLSCALLVSIGCKRGSRPATEFAYVAATQANLRDRLASVYNKVAVVKNGERVEVLERRKRFVRVRNIAGQEGWVEMRHLVGPEIYDTFEKLAQDSVATPAQAQGSTRFELNMHVSPGRETAHLYQLVSGEKVQVLQRTVAEKVAPQSAPVPKPQPVGTGKAPTQPQPVLEDWYLVRNAQNRAGWVLARAVEIDVPLEIAQYAEGKRIVAAMVLNQVEDTEQGKKVPQYLVMATEPKDGLPFDFNQVRVFTWNTRHHRYETAYRERNLMGGFPVRVGTENFDKEGTLPIFVLRVKGEDGQWIEKKYKMNGPIVRRVLAPGEQPAKEARPLRPGKKK